MKITILAFTISFVFSFISELALNNTGIIIGILILFTFSKIVSYFYKSKN